MHYGALSEKYFNEANILKNHIKKLKKQYPCSGFGGERCFKDRVSMLYKIYLEMVHTGKYLKRKEELTERCKEKFYR